MRQIGKNSYIFSSTDFDPENTAVIRNIKVSGDTVSLQWFVNTPDRSTVTGVVILDSGSADENNEIDLNKMYSVQEFIKLTENDFGGSVIRELKQYYK